MTVTTSMTAEELLQRPDDGMRHELVRGELRTMAPANAEHGLIIDFLVRHLGNFVVERGLGRLYNSDTGFLISRHPDTIRCPDVPFVRKERVVKTRTFFDGPPDLAIEVLSPSDRLSEVNNKVREYLKAGTELVIVIDYEQEIAWMRTREAERKLTIDDSLDGGEVVPGWTLPLRELFA
ncbi:MAG TPA: Uma2 family endonuclease [Thermoanaerobaculia bacterium]|nr:Uma2 family endonuclease [Thermoanaerobaculia bacterium]